MWRRDLLGPMTGAGVRYTAPNVPFLYVALGDSTGVGVGARRDGGYVDRVYKRILAAHVVAKLVNLCESGATSETVRIGQASRAQQLRASLATVFLGVNDLWRGTDSLRFGENLTAILHGLRLASPEAALLVGTLPDMQHAPAADFAEGHLGVPKRVIEAHIGSYNREVRRAAALHRAEIVDLYAVHLAESPGYFCPDGYHPSDAGYEAWTELLWRHVEPVARPPRAPQSP